MIRFDGEAERPHFVSVKSQRQRTSGKRTIGRRHRFEIDFAESTSGCGSTDRTGQSFLRHPQSTRFPFSVGRCGGGQESSGEFARRVRRTAIRRPIQIEERLNINALEMLKRAFTQMSSEEFSEYSEYGQMKLDEFTRVVKRCIGSRRGVSSTNSIAMTTTRWIDLADRRTN